MGTEPQQGLRLGLDEGAPGCPAFYQEPFLGLELLFPGKSVVSPPLPWAHGVMLCLYILYKGTCPFPL